MIRQFRSFGLSSLPSAGALCAMTMIPIAPAASGVMTFELCNAAGEVRTVSVPVQQDGEHDSGCAKPCHACTSRKAARKLGLDRP